MTRDRTLEVLWLQSGGCGGCTLSMLDAESPDLFERWRAAGISMLWHPSLSEQSGAPVRNLMKECARGRRRLDVLCLEGAVLRGPDGSGRFHLLAGTGRAMAEWVRELAAVARYTVAVGSCAAYGGIAAAGGNVTDACGLQYEGAERGGLLGAEYRSAAGMQVINVSEIGRAHV